MPKPKIHYKGELYVPMASGSTLHVMGGWAACCSGDRARKIRERGQNTYDESEVTCKRCLALIQKAEAAKCCESPEDDPHACACLASPERLDEVILRAELCDCACHWPDRGE